MSDDVSVDRWAVLRFKDGLRLCKMREVGRSPQGKIVYFETVQGRKARLSEQANNPDSWPPTSVDEAVMRYQKSCAFAVFFRQYDEESRDLIRRIVAAEKLRTPEGN